MVDFSKLPLGTRVIASRGKGVITEIGTGVCGNYVLVTFKKGHPEYFRIDGKRNSFDEYPSLFLDDGTFQWPEQSQPLPELEVDTLIWVREPGYKKWKPRYFSHWDQETERPLCFTYGATSKTAESSGTVLWKEYSLTDPNEPSVQEPQGAKPCKVDLPKGTKIWVRNTRLGIPNPWVEATFEQGFDDPWFPLSARVSHGEVLSFSEYRLTDPAEDSQESCHCRPNLEKGATIWVRNWKGPWVRASFERWVEGCDKAVVAKSDGACAAWGWQEYRLTDPYA